MAKKALLAGAILLLALTGICSGDERHEHASGHTGSPSPQYIWHPGGDRDAKDAVALGFGIQTAF